MGLRSRLRVGSLSHNWAQGQDEMRIVKTRLLELMPDLSVFLDVDALGHTALRDWQHIDISNAVLMFLTEGFFKSGACSKEFMRAIFLNKPMIAVLQTDAARGALSEQKCRELIVKPKEDGNTWLTEPKWRAGKSTYLADVVRGWANEMESSYEPTTSEQVVDAIFKSDTIYWYAVADAQDVSMRLIAERLLPEEKRSFTCYMEGEAAYQYKQQPVRCAPLRDGRLYHLYCSKQNPGAVAVGEELKELAPDMEWTCDSTQLTQSDRMLVLLHKQTWSDGVAREVAAAMRMGVSLLLLHEVNGKDGELRHACAFGLLLDKEVTPAHLLKAGVYNGMIALNLAGGEWRRAGLIRAAQKLAESSGERRPMEVEGPLGRDHDPNAADHPWKEHRPKGSSGRLRLLLWLSQGSWRARIRVAPDGAPAAVHVESEGAASERPLEQLLASPAPAPVSPHRGPLERAVDSLMYRSTNDEMPAAAAAAPCDVDSMETSANRRTISNPQLSERSVSWRLYEISREVSVPTPSRPAPRLCSPGRAALLVQMRNRQTSGTATSRPRNNQPKGRVHVAPTPSNALQKEYEAEAAAAAMRNPSQVETLTAAYDMPNPSQCGQTRACSDSGEPAVFRHCRRSDSDGPGPATDGGAGPCQRPRTAGRTNSHAQAARSVLGTKKPSLRDVGKLHEVGVSAEHCVAQLYSIGYSASEMRDAGVTANETRHVDFDLSELRQAGYSAAELKAAGREADKMRAAGFSAAEMGEAGFSWARLFLVGYTLQELRLAGAPASEARQLVTSVKELLDAGYSVERLRTASVSLSASELAKLSAAQDRLQGTHG